MLSFLLGCLKTKARPTLVGLASISGFSRRLAVFLCGGRLGSVAARLLGGYVFTAAARFLGHAGATRLLGLFVGFISTGKSRGRGKQRKDCESSNDVFHDSSEGLGVKQKCTGPNVQRKTHYFSALTKASLPAMGVNSASVRAFCLRLASNPKACFSAVAAWPACFWRLAARAWP